MIYNNEKQNYRAPLCEVLTIQSEGVIAASGPQNYNNPFPGGQEIW